MRAGLERCPWAHPLGSRRWSHLLWVLETVVVLMAGGGGLCGVQAVDLFYKSTACDYDNTTRLLECDLTNDSRDAELPESQWDGQMGITVIGAKSLLIGPQCKAEKKYLKLILCHKVNTEKVVTPCRVRLFLNQSTAETITSVANLLRAYDSKIKRVNLDAVEQFDFTNSTVDDITIQAMETQSVIISSHIHICRSMVLKGGFRFTVDDSTFGDIKYLNYDSSYMDSAMTNVKIKNVHEGGMVVSNGLMKLDNVIIDSLASKAIRVHNVGELRVERSVITHAGVDSVIMDGGTIEFKEVTIANHGNVSFRIAGTSGSLQPFAIVFGKISTTKYTLIGFAIGFISCLIISGGLFGFILYRKRSIKPDDRDSMELLANNSSVTSKPSPSTPSPKRPEEQKPKQDNIEDDEDYIDVNIQTSPPPPKNINVLSNRAYPLPSTNQLAPPKNQPLPSTTTPATPGTLPPLLPSAATPTMTRQPPPTTAPRPPNPDLARHQKPPGARVAPPLPLRKESMKNTSPSSSSSFSDEKKDILPPPLGGIDELEPYDDTDSLSQSAKPPVPHGKPSFLHTANTPPPQGNGRNPFPKLVANPGQTSVPWAAGGRERAPIPVQGKPTLPPTGQKPFGGSFSAEDDEEDPYETLEEH